MKCVQLCVQLLGRSYMRGAGGEVWLGCSGDTSRWESCSPSFRKYRRQVNVRALFDFLRWILVRSVCCLAS